MYAFIHSATNPIGFSSAQTDLIDTATAVVVAVAVELTFSLNRYFEVVAGINMLLGAKFAAGIGSFDDGHGSNVGGTDCGVCEELRCFGGGGRCSNASSVGGNDDGDGDGDDDTPASGDWSSSVTANIET